MKARPNLFHPLQFIWNQFKSVLRGLELCLLCMPRREIRPSSPPIFYHRVTTCLWMFPACLNSNPGVFCKLNSQMAGHYIWRCDANEIVFGIFFVLFFFCSLLVPNFLNRFFLTGILFWGVYLLLFLVFMAPDRVSGMVVCRS